MNLSNSLLICPEKSTLKKLRHYIHYDLHKFPSSIWVRHSEKAELQICHLRHGKFCRFHRSPWRNTMPKKDLTGLVHIKSFGCTPEMDCIPVLHNISADYRIPHPVPEL